MNVGGSTTHISMELWLRKNDFRQFVIRGRWRSYNTIVASGTGKLLRAGALGDVQFRHVEPVIEAIKGGMKWKY